MDRSTVNGNDLAYDENWRQQVEYQGLKTQQQLSKQHYGSPIAGPEQYSTADVKPDLAALDGPSLTYAAEMTNMQALSNSYEPAVEGPLVGELRSSKALEAEYADADPAFVRKTMALSPKYQLYRTVRGDGCCGWRAIAYRYFEILLDTRDPNRIVGEHARLKSMEGLLTAVGVAPHIVEDFADVTFSLLNDISSGQYSSDMLLKSFNQDDISSYIICHFKMLTSAWMKTNPGRYQPFLEVPVDVYCDANITPQTVEIDHVGLMALVDCIILPAGFAVEVFYLDRSEGDEPTVHRFSKTEGDSITPVDAPVLRLLYRPGHYDIIYKQEDMPLPVSMYQLPPVRVHYYEAVSQPAFSPTPALYGASGMAFEPSFVDIPTHVDSTYSNFRQSMYSIPAFQPEQFTEIPFQTTTFRNSPFNPSHFQSENFQPEIYQPPGPSSSKRNSH